MDRREELGRGGVLPTQPPIVLKIFFSDKNVPCFKVDICKHFKVEELYYNVNHNSSLSPVSPFYRVDVADGLWRDVWCSIRRPRLYWDVTAWSGATSKTESVETRSMLHAKRFKRKVRVLLLYVMHTRGGGAGGGVLVHWTAAAATILLITSIVQSGAARTIVVDVGVALYSHPRWLQPLNVQKCSQTNNRTLRNGFCDAFATSQVRRRPSHRAVASQQNRP